MLLSQKINSVREAVNSEIGFNDEIADGFQRCIEHAEALEETIKELEVPPMYEGNRKHIITKEDIKNYPELELYHWKAGDTIEIGRTATPVEKQLSGENVLLRKEIIRLKSLSK